MTGLQQRVAIFHRIMGQVDPATPVDLTPEIRMKRARICAEEFVELIVSLIGAPLALFLFDEMVLNLKRKRGGKPGDLVEITDGCIDSVVVALGTLLEAGVDDYDVYHAVCDSNDAKVGGGKDEHGKFVKPPGWKPPPIRELLIAQGWKP